ncbi:hypothetical protein GCM10023187_31840 [Nibrella viscosa]|uniref:Cyclophilin-like domain-containing protein n=1 Tax=Nibrella viscosa TaxID=1084524 RepID=A0ABP8KK44_9BACT
MKQLLILVFQLLLLFIGDVACKTITGIAPEQAGPETNTNDTMSTRISIKTGSRTFAATLLNNAAVTAFKQQLPLTLSMKELNRNEKYAQLPNELPTNAANPGTIQSGDLMLYGSNTLVLFYKTFRTSYKYSRLGRIDNPAGLTAALGAGDVTVTFALE